MQRIKIIITGIVQGVGFRPFVYKLALKHHLSGWVLNNAQGVQIEVQGPRVAVEAFSLAIKQEAPPLAVIVDITLMECPLQGGQEFVILHSAGADVHTALVSPDVATCLECQRELTDQEDRRYRYPFVNCTNCGPRYTIIQDVPYDRESTTMAPFIMCPACQAEYDQPTDRRFHAQPNACPVCGPYYWLTTSHEAASGALPTATQQEDVFVKTRQLIAGGAVLAIKGLGGYHLACDARNEEAVRKLRTRKVREDKPFAVMCGSIEVARTLCTITVAEEKMLTGIVRPIVLLAKGAGYELAESLAPGNPYLGVMLPYTPAHFLLLAPEDVWVMTSGNVSDEPIVYEDADGVVRLAVIADFFLLHNRVIHRQADDSVVRIFQDKPYFLRRSRGFVPAPLRLAKEIPPLLATGGEQKNTFCLTRGKLAFMGPHIGDLENLSTYHSYKNTIAHYQKLFDVVPQAVAYDLHPEYLATKYALELGLPHIGVQHHHAHIAAVLAEHGLYEKVIGVALDGTGYGIDGKLWGGEFFVADCCDFERMAHFAYVPLAGGTKAIKEPWRLAAWMLYTVYGQKLANLALPFVQGLPPHWQLVMEATKKGINAPLSSGAGRLFDMGAALLGLRNTIHYEGQAAIELELVAGKTVGQVLPYRLEQGNMDILDFTPTFMAMTDGLLKGLTQEYVAASFHQTLAQAIVETVQRLRQKTGLKKVALSGGVWQNMTLLTQVVRMLEQTSFQVYLHHQVPTNDGGLALGQAVIAGERIRRGDEFACV